MDLEKAPGVRPQGRLDHPLADFPGNVDRFCPRIEVGTRHRLSVGPCVDGGGQDTHDAQLAQVPVFEPQAPGGLSLGLAGDSLPRGFSQRLQVVVGGNLREAVAQHAGGPPQGDRGPDRHKEAAVVIVALAAVRFAVLVPEDTLPGGHKVLGGVASRQDGVEVLAHHVLDGFRIGTGSRRQPHPPVVRFVVVVVLVGFERRQRGGISLPRPGDAHHGVQFVVFVVVATAFAVTVQQLVQAIRQRHGQVRQASGFARGFRYLDRGQLDESPGQILLVSGSRGCHVGSDDAKPQGFRQVLGDRPSQAPGGTDHQGGSRSLARIGVVIKIVVVVVVFVSSCRREGTGVSRSVLRSIQRETSRDSPRVSTEAGPAGTSMGTAIVSHPPPHKAAGECCCWSTIIHRPCRVVDDPLLGLIKKLCVLL
mmetsp:Transcript_1113/g.2787  ORF Transcript_1113/g.2787 Transcript_1113/m.2787 type:complete len:421 (-) Transcript_1113:44-1306(-)